MGGWIPKNCPHCKSRKVRKTPTAGTALGSLFDLAAGIATLGMYLAVRGKRTTTWNYECRKCGFQWQAQMEDFI